MPSALFGDNWLSAIQTAKRKNTAKCLIALSNLGTVRHTQTFTVSGMAAESDVPALCNNILPPFARHEKQTAGYMTEDGAMSHGNTAATPSVL
jgi:hypothetical protein